MNAEISRLRSTGITSSDMRAIWPGALLGAWLAATGALLMVGRADARTSLLHLLLLLAVGAATFLRSSPPWLRGWAPLLVLFFLYAELPALIRIAGHAQPFDEMVIAWESLVFGGQPAREWAAAMPSAAVSEPLHLAYLSYYPIIYVVPALLWRRGRADDFAVATFALMLTFIACFACYVAFPVAGPRYLWDTAAPDAPVRRLATWLLESGSSRGTAFPSSHVAVAVAQTIIAFRFIGSGAGLTLAALTAGLALGAIYGGFHYALDVIAGIVLGAGTALVGLRAARRGNPGQANAMAPT